MDEIMTITAALGDNNRVRILMALQGKTLCVCRLADLLNLSVSTTSKHLTILKQAKLIERDKVGRWVYYRLVTKEISPASAGAINWLKDHLQNDPQILADEQRLEAISQK